MATQQPAKADRVLVHDHMFGVLDGVEFPFETGDWNNGLVRVMSSGFLVYTGIDSGSVRVRQLVFDGVPPGDSQEPWDEIVEFSVHRPEGELAVRDTRDFQRPMGLPPLPQIHSSAISYRFRVHARGRDNDFDKYIEVSAEEYLILAWPAPETPEFVLHASDRCGASLRVATGVDDFGIFGTSGIPGDPDWR